LPQTFVSDKNPFLKQVRRAAAHGALTADGLALAEGPHLLQEAIRSGVEIHTVIAAESEPLPAIEGARTWRVSNKIFAALASTEKPQGVLALIRPRSWTLDRLLHGTPLLVILDGVQDPGNAGAILRAAEAFSGTGAVFLKGAVSPYNPKCLRASAGSVFRLPLVTGLEAAALLDTLDHARVSLYAADPHAATKLAEANLAAGCALIIGAEGKGVSPALAASAAGLRIPTTSVESLNAAVAAGILLYEASRQRSVA
jgi:RNA methyltransferase, TrmH family